jgi:FkbM family methyltransferase
MEFVDMEIAEGWVFATRPYGYDHTDHDVLCELWQRNDYGVRDKEDINVVVDIGGNIGAFSLLICRLYPQSRVITYEPEPENYEVFTENIRRLDHRHQIEPHNEAVWSSMGEVVISPGGSGGRGAGGGNFAHLGMTVHVCDGDPDSPSSICYNAQCRGTPMSVPSVTLDSILVTLPQVDILKIDAEGAEHEMLAKTDIDNVRYLVLEFHDVRGPGSQERLWNKLIETHDMKILNHVWQGDHL